MEFDDAETCSALFHCLSSLLVEAQNITQEKGMKNSLILSSFNLILILRYTFFVYVKYNITQGKGMLKVCRIILFNCFI